MHANALAGGNCNNGLLVGASCLNLNNLVSNSNWNIGAAHSFLLWRALSRAAAPAGAAGSNSRAEIDRTRRGQ